MQFEETPIEDAIEIIQSITCPDEKSACPDGTTTCCPKLNGGYHYCAYPNGVCCKDQGGNPDLGGHCCPHDFECDFKHGLCIGSNFLSMLMDLHKFDNIDPPMEKELMMIWKSKQPISTGNSMQTVSGQKLSTMAVIQP